MKTLKQYLTINESSINLKDDNAKKIADLKKGDYVWGITLEYKKNSTPELVLGTVISLNIGEDVNEYYGGSELEIDIDGKKRTLTFWKEELNGCIYNSSISKFFTSKLLRDKYLEEQIQKDIENINRDFELREKWSKEAIDTNSRLERGEFKSLEEEIGWIENQYDHEYSDPEMNKKMDAECEKLIAAAKKKWNK